MVAAGGIFAGLALAFLIELFLDRSVRRPTDIETKLRLPLFISIPAIAMNGHHHPATIGNHLRLKDAAGDERETAGKEDHDVVIRNRQHSLHRFYEGLRDRLIVYFETRNLTHKPKLVAVTSCGKGAGVSTIAAGLAVSLSETGDGNVLLVNISGEQGAAQQFTRANPVAAWTKPWQRTKSKMRSSKQTFTPPWNKRTATCCPPTCPKKSPR